MKQGGVYSAFLKMDRIYINGEENNMQENGSILCPKLYPWGYETKLNAEEGLCRGRVKGTNVRLFRPDSEIFVPCKLYPFNKGMIK